METSEVEKIINWMKSTDLVELSYKRGGKGFEFRLDSAAAFGAAAFGASSLVSIASPAVGFFRFGPAGTPRKAVEGRAVEAGQKLGLVETEGGPEEVTAPRAGRLAKVLIQEEGAVEYGQPLFLLSPA